jgi:hypothetical protein
MDVLARPSGGRNGRACRRGFGQEGDVGLMRGPEDVVRRVLDSPEEAVEALPAWMDEAGVDGWLRLCEAAMFLGAPGLLTAWHSRLTPAEVAVLSLVERRFEGRAVEAHHLEAAIEVCRAQATRDLALEGRVRMERGLHRYESGDIEGARDDLTWAETRLSSVAKASRDHDLSVLNKAAFHLAVGEAIMALESYGELSRTAGHADESIAISRLAAGRIHADLGQDFDALRLLWLGHAHAIRAGQLMLAIEAGTTFVDLAEHHLSDTAEPMAQQVEKAAPRSAGEGQPVAEVLRSEAEAVLAWCCEACGLDLGGTDRPELRAVALLAGRYGRTDLISFLIGVPEGVDDPMLCAVMQHVDVDNASGWATRMSALALEALDPHTEV